MQQTTQHIRDIVTIALPVLNDISDQAASQKLSPEKWSKKAILGHLIDLLVRNK